MNIIETNFKWNGNLIYNNKPDTIILHHAVMNGTVEDINRVHQSRGWAGIGYPYYVRKDGSIYRGRPEKAIGAHTKGYNAHSIGICVEGNFMEDTMSEAQKNAIVQLGQDIKSRYSIKHVYGHKEVYATACPGTKYPLAEIKAAIMATPIKNIAPIEKAWLQDGDKGADVKDLQTKLNALGFNCGSADGIFGKNTKLAVMKFQKANNLDVDGIAGNLTMAVLNKAKNIPYPGYLLKQNSKKYDPNVKLVQAKLNALSFNCGKVDGYFGNKTFKAVEVYQKTKNLKVDGVIGINTWNSLF